MKLIVVFRWVVAALLVFAAFAKLQSQFDDAVNFQQFNSTAIGVSLVEFTIAAFLIVGGNTRFPLLLTAGLFLVFAIVNAHSILIGQKTCGCLSDISLPAKWMLAIDLVIATACFVAVRACSLRSHHKAALFHPSAKLVIIMFLSAMSLCVLRYSGAMLGVFPAPSLVSTSQVVTAIPLRTSKKSGVIQLPLANPTAHDVSVVGMRVGCDSKLMSQLPLRIASGAVARLELATVLPDYAGESKMVSILYVAGGPELEQRIVVRVAHE